MKSPQEWLAMLKNINFPNFNKFENDEVIEFIFTDCTQRDVLLTWMVIQLGGEFETNRILKHADVIEYLKQRRIFERSNVESFVKATLSKEKQEQLWDRLFYYIKMQKKLFSVPEPLMPGTLTEKFENLGMNEASIDYSRVSYLEPLYQELKMIKNLRKRKESVIVTSGSSSGLGIGESEAETKKEHSGLELIPKDPNVEGYDKDLSVKNRKDNVESSERPEIGMLHSEETTSGTWYCTPDGLQKVFVPIGAPPLGELDFDLKKIRIVYMDDNKPASKKDSNFLEKLEAFLSKKFNRRNKSEEKE